MSTPADDMEALQALCRQIEQAIARGEVTAAAAADLKGAIDETRTRVWATLEARHSGDPDWVQDFWLKRAADICLGVVGRLERGELDRTSQKAASLRAAASHLAAAIGERAS